MAHWTARSRQKNLDELVIDKEHPLAFPAECPTDLMGRIRVSLRAEERSLVAHGFGGQLITVPGQSVGAVVTVGGYRSGRVRHGRALLVLDHDQRILLRAGGLWETYGEVARVCRAARVPKPRHESTTLKRKSGSRRSRLVPPTYEKAGGYRRLRTRPRGTTLRVLALILLYLSILGFGVFLGVLPAILLPEWTGAVRTLIGIAGGLLGAAAGLWVGAAIGHRLADVVRWTATSWSLGTLAPPDRFFSRRFRSRPRAAAWSAAGTIGLTALIPALIGWGPGVGIASLAHGYRDAALVAQLRADGVAVPGRLIDVPEYSTDSNGEETETDVATLTFSPAGSATSLEVTDPSIGGRPLPLNASDPYGTRTPLTVVYLPSDPGTAAARPQITGSVWHGAPTANLISGLLLTLALPVVIWAFTRRVRQLRRRRAGGDLIDELTT